MPLRVGILSAAHGHAWSYVSAFDKHPQTELVGIWDDCAERVEKFTQSTGKPGFATVEELLAHVDAVAIVSENKAHTALVVKAAKAGKAILCEKPLVTTEEEAKAMEAAVKETGVVFMTAFPCRFSPAYQSLKRRVQNGEIGKVVGICATNQGSCPFSWFIDVEKSGGGAMIDHVVHVTDLLRDLLGEDPARVQAQIGNNMYGQTWDDTAMVTLEFPSGVFATLDSSWSRPDSFKTWGGVTMNVVGEEGVIELDMFGQGLDHFHGGSKTHTMAGYGSNFDALMVQAFIEAAISNTTPPVTLHDGLQAARTAIAGYRSVREGQPVPLIA